MKLTKEWMVQISTLSKVRLFVLQAAKVLVGMVLIFEKIFHSIIF
jgi:hypothetical protein